MLNKKFLILGTMSALLATTLFGAGTQNCVGGVCFVNLDNLKPSKGFEKKKEKLMILEKPRYIKEYSQNNNIDKSITIVLDGETITVFPKSTYVMSEEEKVNYLENEEANKGLLVLTQSIEKIEDKILDNGDLPVSEYYCEKNTKPLYNEGSDSFQCV